MRPLDQKSERLASITAEMAKASATAGRKAADTHLIAVSKTRSASEIIPLLAAGQRHFGENRVQEAAEKWPLLREQYPDITLHMVGQLQSNKAAQAVALFDAIHSLDRLSLAKELAKEMDRQQRHINCYIQVNIGEEAQKGGCAIGDVAPLAAQAKQLGLPIVGLMCVPPVGPHPAPYFALLAKLARDLKLDQLSMGMSDDFAAAINLGATHVRVGTALFGERS